MSARVPDPGPCNTPRPYCGGVPPGETPPGESSTGSGPTRANGGRHVVVHPVPRWR
ncbi:MULTISPECIES: DUF6480 family protein [unclassified Streptomyces]|uniref:DUF6480 family protein n=1 Tax=unclassified Streptomyces TaxID=2593676 RepID=UPI002E1096EF|nr:DUF6480 family protein [Streptomyces sp. NBC_01207]